MGAGRSTAVRGLVAAAAAAVLPALPAAASAETDSVRGSTTIVLAPRLAERMEASGVEIIESKQVDVRGRRVRIRFGSLGSGLDPTTGEGEIRHLAIIKLRRGRREAYLHDLLADTDGAHSELAGRVAGHRTRIAEIPRVERFRRGFGTHLLLRRLKLTGTAARILNRRLGVRRLFTIRRPFASLTVRARPRSLTIVGGDVRIAIYEGLIAKLKSLKVETFSILPATLSPSTLWMPIEGGSVSISGRAGSVRAAGGLQLVQYSGSDRPTLNLSEFTVALDTAGMWALFDGPPGRQSQPFAAVDSDRHLIRADAATRTVHITNVVATLDRHTADVFNAVFAERMGRSPLFAAGEPLGSLGLTLHAQ